MKKKICIVLVILILTYCGLLCACGDANGAGAKKQELTFRNMHFGAYYGECEKELKDGLESDGFKGTLDIEKVVSYYSFYKIRPLGKVNVAGYDMDMKILFEIKDTKNPDLQKSRLENGVYEFKCKQNETEGILQDLYEKMVKLYGKPQKEETPNTVYKHTYTWNEFSNNATLSLSARGYSDILDEKDDKDLDTISINYMCDLEKLDSNKEIKVNKNDDSGL